MTPVTSLSTIITEWKEDIKELRAIMQDLAALLQELEKEKEEEAATGLAVMPTVDMPSVQSIRLVACMVEHEVAVQQTTEMSMTNALPAAAPSPRLSLRDVDCWKEQQASPLVAAVGGDATAVGGVEGRRILHSSVCILVFWRRYGREKPRIGFSLCFEWVDTTFHLGQSSGAGFKCRSPWLGCWVGPKSVLQLEDELLKKRGSFKICHERQHDGILAPVLQNLGEAWNILFDRNMD
uniref:Uncharacterized protein n=1 Tax=Oryza barthii TaxID=65489 RepID=A0A0D3GYQ0_9ORYZ